MEVSLVHHAHQVHMKMKRVNLNVSYVMRENIPLPIKYIALSVWQVHINPIGIQAHVQHVQWVDIIILPDKKYVRHARLVNTQVHLVNLNAQCAVIIP